MFPTAQEAICPLSAGDFFAQFDCPRASTLIRRGVYLALPIFQFFEGQKRARQEPQSQQEQSR